MNTNSGPPNKVRTWDNRTEYGYVFLWKSERGCWQNSSGPTILVFPTVGDGHAWTPWRVHIPEALKDWLFTGREAEQEAFRTAKDLLDKGSLWRT